LEVQAAGLGIPSRPEQTSVFGSDSEGGVTSEYGQELIQTVNRKRIREWRGDTESGRVLTTEEAYFALSGATVGIEDSGSAVEADRGYKNKLIAAMGIGGQSDQSSAKGIPSDGRCASGGNAKTYIS
jgi:hypothetical protein